MFAEDRVTVDPSVLAGKPVIRGTRIPVHLILEMLCAGVTKEDILQEYPQLSAEDVTAAIRFASNLLKRGEWAEFGVT